MIHVEQTNKPPNIWRALSASLKNMRQALGEAAVDHMCSWQVVILDHSSGANQEADEDLRAELEAINGNTRLSEHYLQLARDLDVMEAKAPEEVYKMHLVEGRAPDGPAIDSARQNLASTFVNAFVNAGFGTDKLVTAAPEGDSASEVGPPLLLSHSRP